MGGALGVMVETKQSKPEVIITIDGPAGTGKSTVAHRLAKKLGLEFLDTGAMYRAASLIAIEMDIDPNDGPTLARAISAAEMHFDWTSDPPVLELGRRDVSSRIREMDVSEVVSIVAAQSEVRKALVEQQRIIANRHPRLVTEGRDQGSVVFPDAAIRFYLEADVQVRANRRVSQLAAAGKPVDEGRVYRDIQERDRLDSQRAVGPLVKPHGAVEVDTSTRSIDEVVDVMERAARERLSWARFKDVER
ncbi:MAG TPA: (d)CMP kinase [Phycisphaerales bacterium]|nr:(d)CMP kinase [Phycisphaerales bacterium]